MLALAIGLFIGLGRLLPAAIWFLKKSDFISGYPDLGILITALTSVHNHEFPSIGGAFGTLGWWEYNIFVGFVGSFVLAFGLVVVFRLYKSIWYSPIFVAAGFMFILSLGDVYAFITKLPLPFAGIERVSTRFIVMPFVVFLISAVYGIDKLLSRRPTVSKPALVVAIPFLIFELANHSSYWNVVTLEEAFRHIEKPTLEIIFSNDHL